MRDPSAWGFLTRCGYRNAHPFGQALHKLLWDPARSWGLPNCGWLDGGCLILCDALIKWGRGVLLPGGILRRANTGQAFLDHAFAFMHPGQHKPCVLFDGDGLQSAEVMTRKLRTITRSGIQELSYNDCSRLAVAIPRNHRISSRLVNALDEVFGPFSIDLLQ